MEGQWRRAANELSPTHSPGVNSVVSALTRARRHEEAVAGLWAFHRELPDKFCPGTCPRTEGSSWFLKMTDGLKEWDSTPRMV